MAHTPQDDGEHVALMEPMLPAQAAPARNHLVDLATDLVARASHFSGAVPTGLTRPLARMVRAMNCYYSNLIEGHHTLPRAIEGALAQDFARDPAQRNLQIEAAAHIAVQAAIEAAPPALGVLFSAGLARHIHGEFCRRLPAEMLAVAHPGGGAPLPVTPGAFRQHMVEVGRHVPVSPGAVPRFLDRFEEAYAPARLNRIDRIIAIAASHHRLAWIHPLLDGNGRVARLMSFAQFLSMGLGGPCWSVSRGLARRNDEYKSCLAAADMPRRNDLDGRGHLSEAALTDFCAFFLQVAIDQLEFMSGLVEITGLVGRIEGWAARQTSDGRISAKAVRVLKEALLVGPVERAKLPSITDVAERGARKIVAPLLEIGVLTAPTHRAPLTIAFPVAVVGDWFPRLYPPEDLP